MNKNNNHPICRTNKYGTKRRYLNSLFHREDGPAIEYADGSKFWFNHGYLHRLDGSAIEAFNGDKYWYYHGKHIDCTSQEEFEKLINLKCLW